MIRRCFTSAATVTAVSAALLGAPRFVQAQTPAPAAIHARGTFDVTVKPMTAFDSTGGLGRMSLDKVWHGDLEGTGRGEMLTALTSTQGSAGYVAVERVSGTLQGRRGTFVLQHSGSLTRGAQQLTITVVPDSGTDQLVGLAGTLSITITDGRHLYDLVYTLPAR